MKFFSCFQQLVFSRLTIISNHCLGFITSFCGLQPGRRVPLRRSQAGKPELFLWIQRTYSYLFQNNQSSCSLPHNSTASNHSSHTNTTNSSTTYPTINSNCSPNITARFSGRSEPNFQYRAKPNNYKSGTTNSSRCRCLQLQQQKQR